MTVRVLNAFSWAADRHDVGVGQGQGAGPSVVSAVGGGVTGPAGNQVRVTFDRALDFNPITSRALDPDAYDLRETSSGRKLVVVFCTRFSDTEVDLHSEELSVTQINYALTVQLVTDLFGQVVDPANNTATFVAKGTQRPVLNTLHAFFGLQAGMQSDVATGVSPDVDPPVLQNQSPVPGALLVPVDANVIMEIVDPESGLVDTSVVIEIDTGSGFVDAWRNDAQQPGFAVVKTPVAGGNRYNIDPASDFSPGATVQVRVTAQDTVLNVLSTSYQFTAFNVFGFLTVTQSGDLELTVDFADPMQTAGAPGAALVDPASYSITSLGAGVPIAVQSIQLVNNQRLRFTIPISTNGEAYRVEVVAANVETTTGASIQGALGDYVAMVSPPRVLQVTPVSDRAIDVTFSRDMDSNPDLLSTSKYVFTQGLIAEAVSALAPDSVRVTTSRQDPGRQYALTVNP